MRPEADAKGLGRNQGGDAEEPQSRLFREAGFGLSFDSFDSISYNLCTMNLNAFKRILTGIAIVVIGVIGFLWWGKAHPKSTVQPPVTVSEVNRGFSEKDRVAFQGKIDAMKAQIVEKDAAGKHDISLTLQLGNMYYTMGKLALAVEQYQSILKDHPKDAPALEAMGQAYLEMGDFSGAERSWRSALAIEPLEDYYIRLADLIDQHFADREADIRPLLEQAVTNIGQTPGLLARLGDWYAKNNDLPAAISHYEVAQTLAPSDDSIKQTIVDLRAKLATTHP